MVFRGSRKRRRIQAVGFCFCVLLGYWFPHYRFISSQLESTVQIATYIQTFIEKGQAALNWETILSLLRQAGTQPGKLYTFSLSAVYMGLGVVSLVLSICYVFKNKKETRARIVRIAFCVALFILMRIAYQQFNMRLTPKFTQAV